MFSIPPLMFAFRSSITPFKRLHSHCWLRRGKVTVSTAEAAPNSRKRPTPVVFVSTNTPSAVTAQWQRRLSERGFDSIATQFSDPESRGGELLQTWYGDLQGQIAKMGLFPPVMIGHGEAAWRLCQKYVANQPLSALILLDGPSLVDPSTLPSFEFEPYFPVMLMTKTVPSFLLEYKDDVDILTPDDNNEELLLSWIHDAV